MVDRPPRSEKRQRTELVPVRMTKAERRELEAIAAAVAAGSMSALLRESALARRNEVAQLYPASA